MLDLQARRRRRVLAICAAAIGLLELSPRHALANCGLEFCPIQRIDTDPHQFVMPLSLQVTAFERDTGTGNYIATIPRLEWLPTQSVRVGAWLPIIRLNIEDETATGLGNAVLFGEFTRDFGALTVGAGTQVEFPTGASDQGIADDHLEVLGYLLARWTNKRFFVEGRIGARSAVTSGEHDHDDHNHADHAHADVVMPLFVDPHAERELVYRAVVGTIALSGIQLGVTLNGQVPIADAMTDSFVSGGIMSSVSLTNASYLRLGFERALANLSRFRWRTIATAGIEF